MFCFCLLFILNHLSVFCSLSVFSLCLSPYFLPIIILSSFFFSQGILQAHATMDTSKSLCSPSSLLICLFSFVFNICFSVLIFLHLGLSNLNLKFYFSSYSSVASLSPFLWILLMCVFPYGYIFSPDFLFGSFSAFPYFNFLIPSLIPLMCSTFATLILQFFFSFFSFISYHPVSKSEQQCNNKIISSIISLRIAWEYSFFIVLFLSDELQ